MCWIKFIRLITKNWFPNIVNGTAENPIIPPVVLPKIEEIY